jgi:hypothetical protein
MSLSTVAWTLQGKDNEATRMGKARKTQASDELKDKKSSKSKLQAGEDVPGPGHWSRMHGGCQSQPRFSFVSASAA